MFLYNLTLQRPTSIHLSVIGSFCASKRQELVVARGTFIEMYALDNATGKLSLLFSQNVFGMVRSLLAFKLVGTEKDYLIIGSDSGRIIILEYDVERNVFEKVHQETFGKSGSRRIVPGQYLCMDAKGRAVMIGAMEKQKFVYILNRDLDSRLTISSPLDAHKSHTIVFATVGLDVGFENPVFACLEVDYGECDAENGPAPQNVDKMLTFYELDLGLNHVVRKWTGSVDRSSNLLIPVPGGADGPGGVLVCSENRITWMNQNQNAVSVLIPKRNGREKENAIIISSAFHKTKNMFFILIQTEFGDLFKISIDYDVEIVKKLRLRYFDSLAPCESMNIFKSGYLFAACEQGNHILYQITSLGDYEDESEFSSDSLTEASFSPRELRNLQMCDSLQNQAPSLDSKLLNFLNEEMPQFYSVGGGGLEPKFKVSRYGLSVKELVKADLPGNPLYIWSMKYSLSDKYHSFMIVSFVNATIALSVGESIEEIQNTGFRMDLSSVHVGQFYDDSFVQVYSSGYRHIKSENRFIEWNAPDGKNVKFAASNSRQLILSTTGGKIYYFECDLSGNLVQHKEVLDLPAEVSCLSIAEVSLDSQRSRFLVIGCNDFTVRIISLDVNDCFQTLSFQAVTSNPESVLILEMNNVEYDKSIKGLFVHVGLENGVHIRMELDPITGALTDPRSRYLGPRGVKLLKTQANGQNSCLALASKPWLYFQQTHQFQLWPLNYSRLEHASFLSTEIIPESLVAVVDNSLRILSIENYDNPFSTNSTALSYIPRKLAFDEELQLFAVVESSNRKQTEDGEVKDAPLGNWSSCVSLIDPVTLEVVDRWNFDSNEAAFSAQFCKFSTRNNETTLVVGVAKDVLFEQKQSNHGFIYVFSVDQRKINLIHKTQVEDVPYSFCPFQGRLLVGVGKLIRIYDIGMKKLLRKCENRGLPNAVMTIHTQGNRIIVGDGQESYHYLVYKPSENLMVIFADDVINRWITSTIQLDYDTVAGGDKFGNFFVTRIPPSTSEDIDLDPTGLRISEKGYLLGAPNKLERIADFFVGDIITSLSRACFTNGSREAIFYSTLSGMIGGMVPFFLRDDVNFFQNLELHMRNELSPLAGREHLSFRSSFVPVKSVIDGDLCEQYLVLSYEKKREIALSMDKTPNEIIQRIVEFRSLNLL